MACGVRGVVVPEIPPARSAHSNSVTFTSTGTEQGPGSLPLPVLFCRTARFCSVGRLRGGFGGEAGAGAAAAPLPAPPLRGARLADGPPGPEAPPRAESCPAVTLHDHEDGFL